MMELVAKFDCNQGAVRAVRFNKDGNYCITCGADKTVRLWNPYKQLQLQKYSGHSQEVLDADSSHDHAFICSASADKAVFYTDVASTKVVRKFRGHVGRVNCVRFNLDESTLIISGSIDGRVKIWDLRARGFEPLQELDDCKDSVTYLDLNNHQILVSCLDKTTRLYDVRFGKMQCDYIGHPVTCSTLSKDGQFTLVSSLGSTVRLFEKQTGELMNDFKGHVNLVYNVENCMNNECSEIISGSEDGCVYIWDLIHGNVKQKLKHVSARAVHSISYHPEESKLLSAQEQFVFLWKNKDQAA